MEQTLYFNLSEDSENYSKEHNSIAYNKIKAYLTYTKDGSYRHPRGYYLSVLPVARKVSDGCIIESQGVFTGYHQLVKEVNRSSAKALNESLELANKYIFVMVMNILDKYNLELTEESDKLLDTFADNRVLPDVASKQFD